MSLLLLAGGTPPPTEIDLASFDGATFITGPAEVDNVTGVELDLASFDGLTPVAGISVLNADATPGVYAPNVRAELWSRDGNFLSDLTTQSGLQFQEGLNDIGSGRMNLQLDDPDAGLIEIGCEIRCYLFEELVFSWQLLQEPRILRYSEGEDASYVIQLSGPGRPALLQRSQVYPPNGLTNSINAQHRLYTFASVDFPNAGGWGKAITVTRADEVNPPRYVIIEYTTVISGREDIVENVAAAAPNGWPVPAAFWIWGQNDTTIVGKNYFRKPFTISRTGQYAILASADNYFTLYIDGTPILGQTEVQGSWKDYVRVDIEISKGQHVFGCIGVNDTGSTEPGANPAAILVAVCDIDDEGEVINPAIIQTDATWDALPYPPQAPGWTPGQIMIDAITEAQARGSLSGFTYDFTATTDSGGNPWPYLEGFSTPIGSNLYEMITGLVEQGHIDFRIAPGGKLLQMFNQGAIAQNSGIAYLPTGDIDTQEIVTQDFVPQGEIFNSYLIKWTGGYFQIEDAPSIAANGRYEGFASVDAPTLADAQSQATVILNSAKDPLYAIVVNVDPTAEDRFPYLSYGVGEKVQVHDLDGTPTWYQVQGVTISTNDLGRAQVTLELNARLNLRQREQFELLEGLGRVIEGDTKFRNTRMAFNTGKKGTI